MKENIALICPVCEGKTHTQIRCDTVLENFPLRCPKCKQQSIVSIKDGNIISIIKTG